MNTQQVKTNRVRDERGAATLGVMIGMVIGSIVIGGFGGFFAMAQKSSAKTVESNYGYIDVSLGGRHVWGRVKDAYTVLEVTDSRLVFETRDAEGVDWTFYAIESDGDLVTATVPVVAGQAYAMGQAFTATRTLVRDLDPTASWFEGTDGMDGVTFSSDTRLVDIVLDGENGHYESKAAIG